MVKGTTVFYYDVVPDGSGSIIKRIDGQQIYQLTPFNDPAGVIVVKAR